MRKQIWLAMLVVAACPVSAGAQGVLPVSLEARIDAGIPVGDAADLYETGVGFEGIGVLHLTPMFGLYGGYTSTRFGLDASDADVTLDGPVVGGRVTLGTGGGVWTPYAQVGAVFLDDETGFEAGLGAFYPVGRNLSVTPMARYRSVNGFDFVTLGVGLNVRL